MGKSYSKFISCTVASLALAMGGCTFGGNSSDAGSKVARNFIDSGAITISRPAPAVKESSAPTNMLAFLPVEKQRKGKWISIDRQAGTISLMSNEESLITAKGKGLQNLSSGTYEIVHKQRNAPWHASDAYFRNRNMQVPAAGSKERFLRGALGEFALFLDEKLPIHSGPIWSEEIGGVQITEKQLSRIYYSIASGASVEVQ